MGKKGKGPSDDFLRHIPEILPVIKVEPAGMVLFPAALHIGLELNKAQVRAGYPERMRQTPYIIAAPQIPGDPEANIGLLGKVVSARQQEGVYNFNLLGVMRVRTEIVSRANNLILARWSPLIDTAVPRETAENPAFLNALAGLQGLFTEFLENVTGDDFFRNQFVKDAVKRVESLDAENLSSAIDGIMNILNYIKFEDNGQLDISRPSLMVFRETDPITRLGAVIQLLYILLHGEEPVASDVAPDSGQKAKMLSDGKELINILFGEEETVAAPTETAAVTKDNGELDLPEGLEPSGINRMIEFLSGRVVGQDRPIRTIARAFNLASAGLFSYESPLLVLFFAGPTAVGKTEFAYALADFIWSLEKEALERAKKEQKVLPFDKQGITKPPLVEVDCGMFAGELSHGISNLIGSPVGFVGSRGTGQSAQPPILTPANFPPNRIVVLLFDEIEKAFLNSRGNGAEILGVLMKILDKGRFVNNWNEEVDFTRVIIIFTSNIGSVEIIKSAEDPKIGFGAGIKRKRRSDEEIKKLNDRIYDATKREYEKLFRPELRNRIHRFIAFHFLTDANLRSIINKEFHVLQHRVSKFGIGVELSDEAIEWLLLETKQEEGVRQLRRFMEKEIAEPLARANMLRKLIKGKTYVVKTKKTPVKNGKNGHTEVHASFYIKRENNQNNQGGK